MIVMLLSIMSCWEKQDIDIIGPEMPRYTLYGQIKYLNETQSVADVVVNLVQVEVYQGDYLEPMTTTSDAAGNYSFPELYRGRYNLSAVMEGIKLFSKDVGIINFADREYDVEIPRVIHLVNQELAFRQGESLRGLTEYSGSPLALTYYGGSEYLITDVELPIVPEPNSLWIHSGLANMGNNEYASIRRQIDTIEVNGVKSVSGPSYFLSTFDLDNKRINASDQAFSGEKLTNTADQSGFWNLHTNLLKQKFLQRKDISGSLLESKPLAGNQANIHSFNDSESDYWTVDTAHTTIWSCELTDSLYGLHEYRIINAAGALLGPGGDRIEFMSLSGDGNLYIGTQSGIWSAEFLADR